MTKTVTIRAKNGNHYTANVAPCLTDQVTLADTGRTVAIMKPIGFWAQTDQFLYNPHLFNEDDKSTDGREIVTGEIIDVKVKE